MVSLRLVQKVQHFLKIKERGSLTAAVSNATLPDERKKTSPKTQTKSEMSGNGIIESMTEMANRCQTEIEVLKGRSTPQGRRYNAKGNDKQL